MKRVTMRDIAEKSGCSVSTVSKALNGTDRVGVEVIAKIRSIAEELDYQSSLSAQSLAGKNRRVAILLPRDPPEVRLLFEQGFAEDFGLYSEFGIEPSYFLYGDTAAELPLDEIAAGCDGMIAVPQKIDAAAAASLDRIGKKCRL